MTEFEAIYRLYFDDVYRYIRRLSHSESTAEEITGETFLKAMRSIGGFRGECDIRVWLCQIAKHCYYTYLKKNGGAAAADGAAPEDVPAWEETPEEQLIRQDEADRVRQALHHVPEPYKEVFMWRVLGELSFRRIGSMFGKSENWACVTYHRAKAMIQSRMEEQNHEK